MAEPDTPEDQVFYDATSWHFPRGLSIHGDVSVDDTRIDTGDDLTGTLLASGFCNQKRAPGITTHIALVSGTLFLTYFRAPKTQPVNNIKYYSGGTAAGATPSLVKYALFTVATNGDITRVGLTANDTSIFVAANAANSRAVPEVPIVTKGQMLATGLLLVTAAALPTVLAQLAVGATSAAMSVAPRMCAQVTAQADIAASYAAGSIANSGSRLFAELS